MSSSTDDYATIREYLLGRLAAEDREEFEQRFFADEELFEKLQTAEDDLIDDFLSGNLSQDDVNLFQKNFLIGSKREQELRIGKAWRDYASAHADEKAPTPGLLELLRQLFSRAHAPKLAAAAGIIVAAVVGWLVLKPSEIDKGLDALDAAYQQERPFESRITRFHYAPYILNSSTRGADTSRVNQSELIEAELKLRKAVLDNPTPKAHHALGKVYLARQQFDEAIEQFQEALKGDANSARIYADLGAALLEKGKLEIGTENAEAGKGAGSLVLSLKNLNKALELDNNLLEALFNRALLNEAMGLLSDAEKDWGTYLERDPNSKWTGDARNNLDRVEQKLKKTSETKEEIFQRFLGQFDSGDEAGVWTTVSSYQNRTGNVVVEQLIDAYLEAATKNKKEDLEHARQRLSYLGDLQFHKSGDRFFSDLARFYESATPSQREPILKARELMKQGYAGWGQIGADENRSLFENARELFEKAGDYPEVRVADYWISFCHFRMKNKNSEEQRQTLDSLSSDCKRRQYLSLETRALYLLSSVEFNANEHSKAVDAGLEAAQLAKRINDPVGLLNAEEALIEYYRHLGDYQKSLDCIQQSLPLITSTALDPVQGNRHYNLTAKTFATFGLLDAAVSYQREALRIASNTNNDALKFQNYVFVGAIQGKLKNFDEALKNVQHAFDLAQTHAERGNMAYAALQMGNIYRAAEDFDKAVAQYTQSINLYQSFKNFETHLYEAHEGRFLCYLQQQNDQATQTEISILFDLMNEYHKKISDEDSRNTFSNVEQTAVDAAIDFEYSRMNNSDQAFNYSNESRARSLLDLLNADDDVRAKVQDADIKFQAFSEPRPLPLIKEQLPDQTQLVQYVVLENKLLIWVISRNDAQVKMQPISRKELNEKLRRYLDIVSHPPEDNEAQESLLAKELYAILIQPVETLLDKRKLLCIIPDGTLSFLPFAALVSTDSGRYLFEDYQLMTSSSASVFLTCSERALKNSGPREESALIVGNPTFDRATFPEFKYLPDATNEALEVSRYYKSVPLTEARATKPAVNSEFEKSDVINLALHSKIDDEVPLRSKLLLAAPNTRTKDQLSDSVIYAYDIYNLKLSHTRLVVLSSCESGTGHYYGGEGVSSFARAFIGAGVPLVVSSLWPVDSTATEKLMVSFHSHRTQEHISTVAALKSAQRDMLREFRRPYYWAAFTVSGGYAEF
jgi:CHAT domain-containing protein